MVANREERVNTHHRPNFIKTSASALAEGPRDALVSIIARQRASVDSKLLDTPRNIGFYRIPKR